jgi:archaellin
MAYIDDVQTDNDMTYTTVDVVGDDDGLLEPGELIEVTIDVSGLATQLDNNDTFTIEVRPPLGAYLVIQRTTPPGSSLETVVNLR